MPNVDEFNFVLNHAERASPLWLRLKAQLQARLALKAELEMTISCLQTRPMS